MSFDRSTWDFDRSTSAIDVSSSEVDVPILVLRCQNPKLRHRYPISECQNSNRRPPKSLFILEKEELEE